MKSIDFKNAMNQLKEQKSKVTVNDNGKKFVKYSDVIKEKIKENKVEKTILRNFDELEKDREDWYKMRNVSLNKEKELQDDGNKFVSNDHKKTLNIQSDLSIYSIEKEANSNFPEKIEDHSIILEKIDDNPNTFNPEISSSDWENLNKSNKKKEWKITVDPKTVIQEINEDGEKKKLINLDKYTADFKCDELYNWFHVMFINWEKDLDSIPVNMRDSAEERQKFGIYKQCRGYIKPLLRLLKKKEVTKEIMNKLFEIMIFCLDKDYIRAHDKYIELAIGNAPWPMGVTMVGIHERTGRARIAKSQVAHILNDENTKKYLQSVKRIMSLVQRLNPTSPSQSVFS